MRSGVLMGNCIRRRDTRHSCAITCSGSDVAQGRHHEKGLDMQLLRRDAIASPMLSVDAISACATPDVAPAQPDETPKRKGEVSRNRIPT